MLPLLSPCHHYCESFAGSAAVLVNRDPSPIETYNDIDGEVVNFFRVLREHMDQLSEQLVSLCSRGKSYLSLNQREESISPQARHNTLHRGDRRAEVGLVWTREVRHARLGAITRAQPWSARHPRDVDQRRWQYRHPRCTWIEAESERRRLSLARGGRRDLLVTQTPKSEPAAS